MNVYYSINFNKSKLGLTCNSALKQKDIRTLEKLVNENQDNIYLPFIEMRKAKCLGYINYEEGKRNFELLINKYQDDNFLLGEIYYEYGTLLNYNKEYNLSEKLFLKSIEISNKLESVLKYSNYLDITNRSNEAINILESFQDSLYKHIDINMLLGRCYYHTKQYNKAKNIYEGLIKENNFRSNKAYTSLISLIVYVAKKDHEGKNIDIYHKLLDIIFKSEELTLEKYQNYELLFRYSLNNVEKLYLSYEDILEQITNIDPQLIDAYDKYYNSNYQNNMEYEIRDIYYFLGMIYKKDNQSFETEKNKNNKIAQQYFQKSVDLGSNDMERSYLELAYFYKENKEFDEALKIYNSIHDQKLINVALAGKIECLIGLKNYELAISYCYELIDNSYNDIFDQELAYTLLARSYLFLNNSDKAIEYLQKIDCEKSNNCIKNKTKTNAKNKYSLLAQAYCQKEDYPTAFIYFEKAIEIDNDFATVLNYIYALYKNNQYQVVLNKLINVINETNFNRVINYYMSKQAYDLLLEVLPDLIKTYENDYHKYQTTINIYIQLKQFNKAIELFELIPSDTENYEKNTYNIAQRLAKNNLAIKAIPYYEKLIETNPNNIGYKISYLRVLRRTNDYARFTELYNELKTSSMKETYLDFEYAKWCIANKKNDEARSCLLDLLETDNRLYALSELANLEYDTKNYFEARKYYQELLTSSHKDQIFAYKGLTELEHNCGNYDISKEYIHKFESIAKPEDYSILASTESYIGNYDRAIYFYHTYLDKKPNDFTATYQIGRVYRLIGDYNMALSYLDKVVNDVYNDHNYQAKLELAKLYNELEEYEKAKELLHSIKKNIINQDTIITEIAAIDFETENYEQAVAILNDYIENNTNYSLEAIIIQLSSLIKLGRYEQTIALMNKYIEEHIMDSVYSNYFQALILKEQGQFEEALELLLTILEIIPSQLVMQEVIYCAALIDNQTIIETYKEKLLKHNPQARFHIEKTIQKNKQLQKKDIMI